MSEELDKKQKELEQRERELKEKENEVERARRQIEEDFKNAAKQKEAKREGDRRRKTDRSHSVHSTDDRDLARQVRQLKRRLETFEMQEEARWFQGLKAQQTRERQRRMEAEIKQRVRIEERERERIRQEIMKERAKSKNKRYNYHK